MLDDEFTLPFIFVADGADPPPELAEFKSAHPDWVSFPATFISHEQRLQEGEALRTQPASEQGWQPPPRRRTNPPQPSRTDLGAAMRAFRRASAEHPDPVTALRALRDRPEQFAENKPHGPEPISDDSRTSAAEGHPVYVAADPGWWVRQQSIGNGECVPLVQQATGAPATSRWHRGSAVKGNTVIAPGTAIATFDGDGRYGNHTDGRSHAAIYLGQDARGIHVIDQWNWRKNGRVVGHRSPHDRTIFFDPHRRPVDNGDAYYVIE